MNSLFRWAAVGFVGLTACGMPAKTPETAVSDAVGFSFAMSNKFVKADLPATSTIDIVIEAKVPEHEKRPPVNLALVIDTSGSMEGKAIEDARSAASALVHALGKEDRLAVVTFSSKATLLLASTLVKDADISELDKQIAQMKAEGTTNMQEGLSQAVGQVAGHLDTHGINRVLVLGDGVPNAAGGILSLAQSARSEGIAITTLGLGPDYSETLMGEIAEASGGSFHHVDDSKTLVTFFHDEVLRMQHVYAKNVTLELSPGPGVTITDVIGHDAHDTFRSGVATTVRIPDLSALDKRDVVIKLSSQSHKDGAAVELVDATLRFTDGLSGASIERHMFIGAHSVADSAKLASGKDESVDAVAQRMQEAADALARIKAQQSPPPGNPPVTGFPGGASGGVSTGGSGSSSGGTTKPVPPSAVPMDQNLDNKRKQDQAQRTIQGI